MTRTIPLTRGYVATVDDEDYELLSGYSWSAEVSPRTAYAVRSVQAGGTRTQFRMHRVIVGAQSGEEVDHVNHDGLDNRRSNLRICAPFQNSANRRRRQGTSSRFKGVSWHRNRGKWHAKIKLNGSQRYLGIFTDEVEAAKAYDQAALSQWGDFACLNFPPVRCAKRE